MRCTPRSPRCSAPAEFTGVRSEGVPRRPDDHLHQPSLTTMVTISGLSADQVRIDGWIAPGGEVSVELRTRDRTFTVSSDADGRFVFDERAAWPCPVRLHPRAGGDGPGVVTPTIEL